MNSIDTILNLSWACLCAGALGYFWQDRRAGGSRHVICSRRTLSVILAAVSLFPCISATDDRMHLADMGRSPSQDAAVDRTTSHNLLLSLQLEDPEHGQTTQPFLLTFTACFYLIARLEARKIVRQFSYSSLGRAPPALTVA
ncbi:MAG TPA: hypothetical protein VN841_21755 [Bryobacteraceae bacterium]|nr:hypothetical protein [Bryobacteraceae bacterium]